MAKKKKEKETPEEHEARVMEWLRLHEWDDDPEDEMYAYDPDNDYDPDYIPPGCRACGGPYPNCKASCPLFDE